MMSKNLVNVNNIEDGLIKIIITKEHPLIIIKYCQIFILL